MVCSLLLNICNRKYEGGQINKVLPASDINVEIFANPLVSSKSGRSHFYPICCSESSKIWNLFAVQKICIMVLCKKLFDLTYGLPFYSDVLHTSFCTSKLMNLKRYSEPGSWIMFVVVLFGSSIFDKTTHWELKLIFFFFFFLWINIFRKYLVRFYLSLP